MSGLIGEIEIRSPKLMLYHASTGDPTAVIETRYHAAAGNDVPYLFYVVRCEDFDRFDRLLSEDPTVATPTVVAGGEGERLYRVEPTPEFLIVSELTRLGGALLNAWCRQGTWLSRVQLPDRDTIAELRSYSRSRDVAFEVRRLYRATPSGDWGDGGLTNAQREALVAAFEAGYFGDPRDATLEDVACTLGISSTAAGRRLRRGTARLVENVLLDGR